MRIDEIRQAMNGARCAQVGDMSVVDVARDTLTQLSNNSKYPLPKADIARFAKKVATVAGRTNLYVNEIPISLRAGAAGELGGDQRLLITNLETWIRLYSNCNERQEASRRIVSAEAVDRKRMDAVVGDELRKEFEEDGLMRAWVAFIKDGSWNFREGYGAVLYKRIGKVAINSLLNSDRIAEARVAARASVRRDYPQKYRTAPDEEVDATGIFAMHFAAQLARAYFETLKARSLDITWSNERDGDSSPARL